MTNKKEKSTRSKPSADFSMARVAGFEPARDGVRVHCLTAWRYPYNVSVSKHDIYNNVFLRICQYIFKFF